VDERLIARGYDGATAFQLQGRQHHRRNTKPSTQSATKIGKAMATSFPRMLTGRNEIELLHD
jgi:hypothetical protein